MDFSPVVYEHAAALIGSTPHAFSRDERLLAEGHLAAHRLYGHSPVVVGSDIYNLEAEAYGATVLEPDGPAVPSLGPPIAADADALAALPPLDPQRDGRLAMVLRAAGRVRDELGGVDVRVPLSGPFSIAAGLMGLETLICETAMRPGAVAAALEALCRGQRAFAEAARQAGLGVSLFESAATPPMLSPAMFEQVVLPALGGLCGELRRLFSAPPACILGGDTAKIVDSLAATGAGFLICPAETDQRAFLDSMQSRPGIRVRVNLNPAVLVCGDWGRIERELRRVRDLAELRENCCVGTGVVPFETPPDIILRIAEWFRRADGSAS
jgi:uroporphyrinogen decarboxylase